MAEWQPTIPHIDPRIGYRGVSELRKLNAGTLRRLEGLLVIQDNGEPVAIVAPFELYLEIQKLANMQSVRKVGGHENRSTRGKQ